MSGKESYHRNANDSKGDAESDFEYFITSDLPIEQIINALRLKKLSDTEIDNIVEKVKESRDTIRKVVRRFLGKINQTYGHLDIPDLIKKGMRHADKYGLTPAQKKVFREHVLKGDIYNEYTYQNEYRYTPMAKFLGFDYTYGQMVKLEAKDFSKLNELQLLYDETKHIHADLKMQVANYRDCAPEAITGQYDRLKHNVSVSIHPLFAALFFPKVEYLERRMLHTNIARMVLTRAQAYLKDHKFNIHGGFTASEIDADFDLAHDIAQDPNTLDYFEGDSPMDNVIKRYRAQVELYKVVMNLRQGRFYSTDYNQNDGITDIIRTLNSYEWTFFDSPELFHVQDEGTLLRKLLAIFSCRPTFTQLSSFSQRYGLGFTNISSIGKTVFVNIPIVNIKLPIDLIGNQIHSISLSRALSQTDYFIEHKIVVPKNKSVIYSNEVAFFYANRRYPTTNFYNSRMSCRFMSMPTTFINQTTINRSLIEYDDEMRIGRDWFTLRSVVMLQRPPISGAEIVTGCSAAIAVDPTSPSIKFSGSSPIYIHYNPSVASIQYLEGNQPPTGSQFVANTPVSYIDNTTLNPSRIGFRSEAKERGTIFFYVKR